MVRYVDIMSLLLILCLLCSTAGAEIVDIPGPIPFGDDVVIKSGDSLVVHSGELNRLVSRDDMRVDHNSNLTGIRPVICRITFDYTGSDDFYGSPIDIILVKKGDTIDTLPIQPAKDEHIFVEWNTQADGNGIAFTNTTVVNSDMTVYAKWWPKASSILNSSVSRDDMLVDYDSNHTVILPKICKVKFDYSGSDDFYGSPVDTFFVVKGGTIDPLPIQPAKDEHIFIEWTTRADGNGVAFTNTTVVNNSMTVYAKWMQEYITSSNGVQLVAIPAGKFMMGSNDGQPWERPVHEVNIAYFFYMGVFEVTQAQWKAVMGNNPSYFKGDDLPVESISWSEANDFVHALNANESTDRYRLPSEAEWEYACRAGSTTKYHFGNDVSWFFWRSKLGKYAWYNGNSGEMTHPVGEKLKNDFGLFDMHGNVNEWCEDTWNDNYNNAPPNGGALFDAAYASDMILRGGSWFDARSKCCSASRNHADKGSGSNTIGLRLVKDAKEYVIHSDGDAHFIEVA